MVSFDVQKFLILVRSWFICFLLFLLLLVMSKKPFPNPGSQRFTFSAKSLTVLAVTFMSMICLKYS